MGATGSLRSKMCLAPAVSTLLVLMLSGCVSDLDVSGPEQSVWEATLQGGIENPGVFGNAAALSDAGRTEAGIQVSGLVPGTYIWRIRGANCQSPGSVVGGEGQYPDLIVEEPEPDEEPEAASAQTAPFRATLQVDASYHVEVRLGPNGERLACGSLIRQ